MRLKRETYRHVEAEIRDYNETLKEIQELRRRIMERGESKDIAAVVNGAGPGDPTGVAAARLADSVLLREMERITEAIRQAYKYADDETKLVLWGKYGLALDGYEPPPEIKANMAGYNGYTMDHAVLADKLRMAERTFYEKRSGFIKAVAVRLGWR